jgi:hypothetical protein
MVDHAGDERFFLFGFADNLVRFVQSLTVFYEAIGLAEKRSFPVVITKDLRSDILRPHEIIRKALCSVEYSLSLIQLTQHI